jgi:hypothetical protein
MIDKLVSELERAKVRVACDAMKRQLDGKDASFEYGKAVGTYAGLQAALDYINRLLAAEEEDLEDY